MTAQDAICAAAVARAVTIARAIMATMTEPPVFGFAAGSPALEWFRAEMTAAFPRVSVRTDAALARAMGRAWLDYTDDEVDDPPVQVALVSAETFFERRALAETALDARDAAARAEILRDIVRGGLDGVVVDAALLRIGADFLALATGKMTAGGAA